MDRTLNRAKKSNKRRKARNHAAWKRFSPDGQSCWYCPHPMGDHFTTAKQPYFYTPLSPSEQNDRGIKVYTHELPDGNIVPVKRVKVAQHAELITAFCKTCADDKDTTQVLCYQRTLANGEVIGLSRYCEQT